MAFNPLPVFTQILVSNKDHPRFQQAGHVVGNHPEHESVAVKFDTDNAEEAISRDDIRQLT